MNLRTLNAGLDALMEAVHGRVFPDFGGEGDPGTILETLLPQVGAPDVTEAFLSALPRIRDLLHSDVDALAHKDPAVTRQEEIIACYPAVTALLHYRTAHVLLELGVPVLPRMLTELAHARTGIDIHPGAVIGDHFAIDHGTGVVIGGTAVIGSHVTIYQGVTLGAKSFRYGEDGLPLDVPRHPVLGNGVTVYSNASLLGRIHIGNGAVIGGNVWLTHDLPAGSRIVQGGIRETFSDGAGI